jgi:hypothetical protein
VPTSPEALPPGSVLLHIGPHKTGTTTLQGAFHVNRESLAAQGVHYAGRDRQPMLAALAMSGRPGRLGDEQPTHEHWSALVDEVGLADSTRVVVSSEFFADCSDETAAQVVRDLGGDCVHVVVTLRSLTRIMPSQWQQYVQNGMQRRYVEWLERVLADPPLEPRPRFWFRHAHGDLVERWAGVAGADNVTVIVLDESDRGMLLRTFEALLDLPVGTLVPEADVVNRSLTAGEVEIVRLLNEEFHSRDWDDHLYGRFVRDGVAKRLIAHHVPTPGEAAITTPRWALERAAALGARAADQIRDRGVRVIGDLRTLSSVPDEGGGDPAMPADPPVPASAAASAIVGTILAGEKAPRPSAAPVAAPAVVAAVDAGSDGGWLRRARTRAREKRQRPSA